MNLWESSIAPLRGGKETGFAGERSEPIPPRAVYKIHRPYGRYHNPQRQRPLSNFRTLRTFGPKGCQPFSLNLRNPFIYPIKRGISSLGDETITLLRGKGGRDGCGSPSPRKCREALRFSLFPDPLPNRRYTQPGQGKHEGPLEWPVPYPARLAPDFLMIAHGPVKEAGEKGACQHLHIPVILIGSHGSQNAMAPKAESTSGMPS